MLERKVSVRELLKRLGLYANKNENRGSEAQDQFIERWLRVKTGILVGDTTTEPTDPLDIDGDGNISGNLAVGGNVDGRDVATDGTKLDTVETNAKDDQTGTEIVALLEALAGAAKLSHDNGLSDVSVDDHHAQIHAAEHVTGGGDVVASAVAAGNAGLMTGADKTKLDGIASGATIDQTGLEIVTLLEALAALDRLDHGSGLTGLGDDDHTIYLLAAGTRDAVQIKFDTAAAAPDADGELGYESTYKRLRFFDGSELRFIDPRSGAVNQDRLQLSHITTHIGSVGASAGGNYAAFSAKETMRIQEISIWARAEAGTTDATVDVKDDGSTILTGVTTIAAAATMYTASIEPKLATIAEGSTVSIYLITDADGSLNDLTVDIAYYAS